jgi:hypothetical protein
MKIGQLIEFFLYQRGIRKLPISVQDSIMKVFTGSGIYATPNDFEFTTNAFEATKCQTFIAICKK